MKTPSTIIISSLALVLGAISSLSGCVWVHRQDNAPATTTTTTTTQQYSTTPRTTTVDRTTTY